MVATTVVSTAPESGSEPYSHRTDLFPLEQAMREFGMTFSTISLFPGLKPKELYDYLSNSRLPEIVEKNPWLLSSIIKGKQIGDKNQIKRLKEQNAHFGGEQWEWTTTEGLKKSSLKNRLIESSPGSGKLDDNTMKELMANSTTVSEKMRAKTAKPILLDISEICDNIQDGDNHKSLCEKLGGKNRKKINYLNICKVEHHKEARSFCICVFGIKNSKDSKNSSDSTTFHSSGLFVCMSHAMGDGHTCYKILNMLSYDSDIQSMIYHRNFKDYTDKGIEFAFLPESIKPLFKCLYFNKGSCGEKCCMTCGFLGYMCCFGKKMGKEKFSRINKEVIEQIKQEYKQNSKVNNEFHLTDGPSQNTKSNTDSDFISTNDIITSVWMNSHSSNPKHSSQLFFMEMAINARHRKFPGLSDPLLAGNYVCSGLYMMQGGPWGKEGMDDLSYGGIRQGLKMWNSLEQVADSQYQDVIKQRNIRVAKNGTPTFFQIGKRGTAMGAITNWSGDFEGIRIDSQYECTSHMPANIFAGGECLNPNAVIYKEKPGSHGKGDGGGEIAVYSRSYASKQESSKDDVVEANESKIFGERLTEKTLEELMKG